jgi:hypothetical protein
MAKAKPKLKRDPFEPYARAIQNDIAGLGRSMKEGFQSIREEMATKVEFRELKADIKDLRGDLKMLTDVMVSKSDLERALDESKPIADLRERIERVEGKLGIKASRYP